MREIFGTTPERDGAAFRASTGIAPTEEGDGRLYPMSRRAEAVRDALLNTCRREDITVMACAEPTRHSTGPTGLHEFTVDQARLPLSHKPGRDEKVVAPSQLDAGADQDNLPILGRMPLQPELAAACDAGALETELPGGLLPEALASVEAIPEHEAPEPKAGA